MIQLNKQEEPEVLENNKENWTENYKKWLSDDDVPKSVKKSYNKKDIKRRLVNETSSKCAYCESKISHITYEHIEHIKPKSKFPDEFASWNNLTIACPKCNNNKGTEYDTSCPPINPYMDDPDEHFHSAGPMILTSTHRGKYTEEVLSLNRTPLIEKRTREIKNIENLASSLSGDIAREECIALIKEIENRIAETAEYSFVLRKFITDYKGIEIKDFC